MFEERPSLLAFQPHFYLGGPERFHLPFAYDLVAKGRPKMVVTLGFGEGEVHFTLCQAVVENRLPCRILALCVSSEGEQQEDNAWQTGLGYNEEFYRDFSTFVDGSPEAAAASAEDKSVDLLFLNDCDSSAAGHRLFEAWAPKISPTGVILVHGIGTKREQGVSQLWREIRTETSMEFSAGVGLGVTSAAPATDSVLTQLIGETDPSEIESLYLLAVERIATQARAERISGENRLLQLRQVWVPTLLDDRIQMQERIDHLNRHIAHITRVHEWNEAQLRHQLDSLGRGPMPQNNTTVEKGTVEGPSTGEPIPVGSRRSLAQKIVTEIQRIPRNLRRLWKADIGKKKRK